MDYPKFMPQFKSPLNNQKIAKAFFSDRLKQLFPDAESISGFRLKRIGSMRQESLVIKYSFSLHYPNHQELKTLWGNYQAKGDSKNIYNLFSYIHNHGFSAPPYQIPRPLIYYSPQKLFVYEEFPGKLLRELIESKQCAFQQLRYYIGHIARWLLKLHALPAGVGKYRAPNLSLKNFSSVAPRVNLNLSKTITLINTNINKIKQNSKKTLVHGDPHLANFVVGERKNYALIDLSDSHQGYALYDLGMFLVHIDIALKPFFSPDQISKLKANFVKTYFAKHKHPLPPKICLGINTFQARAALDFLKFTLNYNPRPNTYLKWTINRLQEIIIQSTGLLENRKQNISFKC